MTPFQLIRNLFRAEVNGSSEHRHRLVNFLLKRSNFARIEKLLSKLEVSVVYDIGAHKGDWCREFQEVCGERFEMFLFEPNPTLLKHLSSLRHKVFNVALSDTVREVSFFMSSRSGDSYYLEDTGRYRGASPTKVMTETIDNIVSENKISIPDFIKIDTQGSEIDILRGAKNSLGSCKLLLIEIPLVPYNIGAPVTADYFSYLEQLDFLPIEIGEIHRGYGLQLQVDILFIRKEAFRLTHPGVEVDMAFLRSR